MEKLLLVGAIGAAAAVVGLLIYKKISSEKTLYETEKIVVDELTVGEVKEWFDSKLKNTYQSGVLFVPTKENAEKWNVKISTNDKVLLQIVFDSQKDEIIAYREIMFNQMSDKMQAMLDENNGTVVIKL